MKKFALKSLLSVGLLSLFVVSCSDDPAPAATPATPTVPEATANTALSKILNLDKEETVYTYNADKLVTSISSSSAINKSENLTEFVYEGTKLMSKKTVNKSSIVDGVAKRTYTYTYTYVYDGENISQELSEYKNEYAGSTPSTGKNKSAFTYDESGNLTSVKSYYVSSSDNSESLNSEVKNITRDANSNITEYEVWQNTYVPGENGGSGTSQFLRSSKITNTFESQKNFVVSNYPAAYQKIQYNSQAQKNVILKTVEFYDANSYSEERTSTTNFTNTIEGGKLTAYSYRTIGSSSIVYFTCEYKEL